jgi:predicted nucleotidyltransferase
MARSQNPNLLILELTVAQLGELADEMVFLGGCATGLLITDPAAPPIRATKDVDAIVQVVTLTDYYLLSEKLRAKGFMEDASDDAPICRWVSDQVILDVMPTDTQILGFGNRWYASAVKHAVNNQLPSGKPIRMVSAPYFLITKLEAFDGRGGGDYLGSHDIEDLIAVLDGRPSILDEVKLEESKLVKELSDRFKGLLQDDRFIESVSGHLLPDVTSPERSGVVLGLMKRIAEIQ